MHVDLILLIVIIVLANSFNFCWLHADEKFEKVSRN